MKIFATCGHDISAIDDKCTVVVARLNKAGQPVLSYETACKECERKMSDAACLPTSKEDEEAVLSGEWGGGFW